MEVSGTPLDIDLVMETVMRVAIPTFNGRIAPTFDWATAFLVADIESGSIVPVREMMLKDGNADSRVAALQNENVDTVVCGGISRPAASLIEQAGLQLIAGVCGCTELVLQTLAENGEFSGEWAMPGWRPGRGPGRRRRRGCGRKGKGRSQ